MTTPPEREQISLFVPSVQDRVLLEVQEGLQEEGSTEQAEPLLVVHPNYVVD